MQCLEEGLAAREFLEPLVCVIAAAHFPELDKEGIDVAIELSMPGQCHDIEADGLVVQGVDLLHESVDEALVAIDLRWRHTI